MQLTMSRASLPVMRHYLEVLAALLVRAEQHVLGGGGDPATLLDSRLVADMYPLRAQVQFACDFAKGAVARLGQHDVPRFADDEQSFADLAQRIAATLAIIDQADPPRFDDREEKEIALTFAGQPMAFGGADYLTLFALPSMLFHISIAYALIRAAGVPIGKADFLGDLPLF